MSFCTREQVAGSRHQIDARRHHRGRVNQRADRRGAFHRVRQPDVQRKLRRFCRAGQEEQQRNRNQHRVIDREG
jgi:hypothetical protein